MSSVVTLIKCLPILLGLIKTIQDAIDKAETDKAVSDHLLAIQKAFDAKDATALNNLFNK